MDTVDNMKALRQRIGRGDRGTEMDKTALYMGEVLASFVPGVTTAVSKLLTTATNLGQVWPTIITITISTSPSFFSGNNNSELTALSHH